MNSKSSEYLSQTSNQLLKFLWGSNPVEASLLGIHDYDDTFGDQSAEAYDARRKELNRFLIDLQANIDIAELSSEEAMDYQLCISLVEKNAIYADSHKRWASDPGLYVSMAVWGCMVFLIDNTQPMHERMRCALDRMRQIPDLLEAAKRNISNPPPEFVDVAIDSIPGALEFFDSISRSAADVSAGLEHEVRAAAGNACSALKDYEQWIETALLPYAHGDFAIGRHAFEQLLFSEHRLTYSPEELVPLAITAMTEAEQEIEQVARSIDPSAHWRELIARFKLEHPGTDALMETYREQVVSARKFVIDHDIATIPDDESLTITWTPALERSTIPYLAYFPASPFARDKSGTLWITPVESNASEAQEQSQLMGHCKYRIPIIAVHEGYPGHHLQFTRQFDAPSPLAKQMSSNLLIEGWGLYCEQMMYEQGFLIDPRVRLFQLKDVLWRCARVIVDVGLHTQGMTVDEAVRILVDKGCIERINAISEVKRYTLNPTQPMSYLIGKLLILDLRGRMMLELGRMFDLKHFHDQLLGFGAIPTPIIARHMLTHPDVAARKSLRKSA